MIERYKTKKTSKQAYLESEKYLKSVKKLLKKSPNIIEKAILPTVSDIYSYPGLNFKEKNYERNN